MRGSKDSKDAGSWDYRKVTTALQKRFYLFCFMVNLSQKASEQYDILTARHSGTYL